MNSFPKEDKKIAIYFIVGMFITFLLLTLYVTLFPPTFIDIEFSEEVQENMSPFLDVMMKTVSWFGNKPQSIIVPLGIAIIFLDTRYKMEAFFTLLSLLASAINYGIKILVNRPRPTDDLVNVIIDAKYQSFPSGHTVHYVVFFSFLAFLMYRLKKKYLTLLESP